MLMKNRHYKIPYLKGILTLRLLKAAVIIERKKYKVLSTEAETILWNKSLLQIYKYIQNHPWSNVVYA